MNTLSLINRAHEGDKASRDKILMENTGLIWSVVKRFLNRGYEGEELFQIGCIGMLKAIDRFDAGFNVEFSTYAVPMITGEIRRFLRDDGIIKISRKIKENQARIIAETEKYREEYNCEPTIDKLVQLCGLTPEEVITAMDASKSVQSIDRETETDGQSNIKILDKIEDKNNFEGVVFNRILIRQVLETLDEQDRRIIIMRYFQNMTQSEIARRVGMTQVQISRMEKKILKKLKEQIG